MNERRKIENAVRKKDMEIQELEVKISEARIYVRALQDVLKMLPKDTESRAATTSILRAGSAVSRARDLILKAGKALHINEILGGLGQEVTRDTRAALTGSLAAYVRKSEIFVRPAPNTYGLAELGHASDGAMEPPPNFGRDAEDDIPF